jgi:hypothetical protein
MYVVKRDKNGISFSERSKHKVKKNLINQRIDYVLPKQNKHRTFTKVAATNTP